MLEQWIAKIESRPKTVLAACALTLAVQVGPWWYSSIDSASYLSLARSLAKGTGPTNFGSRLWWYSPGYPALISPLFLLGERPFLAIAVLQWSLAVGLLIGVFRWARQVVPEAAVWIAALTVVNHGLWIHFRRPLSEVAFMCALVWTVNCLREMSAVKSAAAFAARLALAAFLTALVCLVRPVGVMLVPACIVWATLEARHGRWSWPRAWLASAAIVLAAGTPVACFVAHERGMAAALGGRSYADEFHDAARSPWQSYSRGAQLCVSDVGRICLPGLFKSHGTPGDWADPNMLLHMPFFALVVWGWWRWRRQNDLFAWYVPFYLLLIAAHAMDTGARLLLPLLPALFVCAWLALERIGAARRTVAVVCLLSQAAVGGAYWLAVDLPRARHFDRQWSTVEALAAPIRDGAPAVLDGDAPTDLRLMLQLALDRPVASDTQRR